MTEAVQETNGHEDRPMREPDVRKKYLYHKPSSDAQDKVSKLRKTFSAMEDLIESLALNSRERAMAITCLEESAMWAVKAVVSNDPDSEATPL